MITRSAPIATAIIVRSHRITTLDFRSRRRRRRSPRSVPIVTTAELVPPTVLVPPIVVVPIGPTIASLVSTSATATIVTVRVVVAVPVVPAVASISAVVVVVATIVALVAAPVAITVLAATSVVVTSITTLVVAAALVASCFVTARIVPVATSIAIVVLVVATASVAATAIPVRSSTVPAVLRCRRFVLLGVLLQLTLLVVDKVVKDRHRVLVRVDDLERLQTLGVRHLLRVARVCDGFVLVVFQPNLTQLAVRDVLDVDPAHLEGALPLVLRPNARDRVVVDGRHHLGDPAKVARPVDGEEQIDHAALFFALAVRLIEPLVAVFGRAPDLVLDAAVDVVLRVGLDHEEPGQVGRVEHVARGRIVVVLALQLVDDDGRRGNFRGHCCARSRRTCWRRWLHN